MLTTRNNRLRHGIGSGRNQNQHVGCGWLFQHFQHGLERRQPKRRDQVDDVYIFRDAREFRQHRQWCERTRHDEQGDGLQPGIDLADWEQVLALIYEDRGV